MIYTDNRYMIKIKNIKILNYTYMKKKNKQKMQTFDFRLS